MCIHHGQKAIFGDGKQYALPHVFVNPDQLQTFINQMTAVFDGTADPISDINLATVPAEMQFSDIYTAIGAFSAQAYKDGKPPYPMGQESVGVAVRDMDNAVRVAEEHGVKILARWEVMGNQEAMTEWLDGLRIQFYAYAGTPPEIAVRESVSNTRYYLTPRAAERFIKTFLAVTDGRIVGDARHAGEEVGLPGESFRRVWLASSAGLFNVIILSDAQRARLASPWRDIKTDFVVDDLAKVIALAQASQVSVLVPPEAGHSRHPRAVLEFTGGYVIALRQKA
ncbi:hypothetical protein QDZ74_003619 [Pluralibacter gergoviae]|uniref:hypothetical protein n=1 Tax=Pluralibacter gergoviae TaxID=61647 RepID=UPI0004F59FEB|nr:hypothetical protein [Pluralibacter gergoviae]AIR01662.1 hypothetical protein LG71_17965 [Pluralibacter gergoviae]EKT9639713.1 hypothetical protein [Pluralibacter gergoviae]EKV3541848.1 hypothetical protein [Pluralibacter gergoviae]EKV9897185.1 hypothetical protein [Pluralibacter gergoviae]EKV9929631.1 hypothetical protein [Pluralibacter gergoviae]